MALDKYREKRNFTISPEPSGDKARTSPTGRKSRFFCVQKHLASHLHYDFRLEHNGVLLSWAVPKGPSLDPTIKRLAMHVEDHPIEYGDFEGVIPEGYGAGIVMLWDRGTWTPETDDIDAALKKGDLKFTLDGYKLKGSWVLVRTKGPYAGSSGDGRSWLLIKHKDDWSGAVDIAEFAPLSVKSEGDFADILSQGNPDVWQSNRPAKGGDTGALFERIIRQAQELKNSSKSSASSRSSGSKSSSSKSSGSKSSGSKSSSSKSSPSTRKSSPGSARKAARPKRART
jgi:bifunctional non-homologous end joining protein LigD